MPQLIAAFHNKETSQEAEGITEHSALLFELASFGHPQEVLFQPL